MVLQPFSSAWAEQRGAAAVRTAAHTQFLKAHERAVKESSSRQLRPEPALSHEELQSLIQQKIKYVFVLYQENRSFDSYFGTFPGANGLYSPSLANSRLCANNCEYGRI